MLSSSLTVYIVFQNLEYFFLYSFLGWLMETVLCSVRERKFIDRGFLAGPVCPIYGVGMLLLIFCLSPLKAHPLLLFFGGILCASALEYFTSWCMEKLFHAKWWDYQDKKCNLHGRICLSISIAWGVLTVVFFEWIHPVIASLFSSVPYSVAIPIITVLSVIFLADLVQSVIAASQLSQTLKLLEKADKIKLELDTMSLRSRQTLQKKLDELKERLETQKCNLLQKRLIHAYPQLKSIHGKKVLKDLRNICQRKKPSHNQDETDQLSKS